MTAGAHVVLVGAGHAHLYVAARVQALLARGAAVTLVDPGDFWYSGRATGMLGGHFDAAADCLDARALIEAAGGAFVAGRVTAIDRDRRRLHLADGGPLDYDFLSLNVGSVVRNDRIEGIAGDPDCWPVKPIAGLWQLRGVLEAQFDNGARPQIAVVGGGATGCEIAANLAASARRCGADIGLRLLHRGARIAASAPAGASRRLRQALEALGVVIDTGCAVVRREANALSLDDGRRVAADIVVLAHGLHAPAWLDNLDLPSDDGLRVDASLRSVGDARIFAVGDCANLQGQRLPRLGVFGVRQAPVLHANLAAAVAGGAMRRYQPQSRWLSILDLGDGTGLATRGNRWWFGRSSLWLKRYLDRRFLEGYRRYGA